MILLLIVLIIVCFIQLSQLIIMKRYTNALLRGIERHAEALSDVMAADAAAKAKVKMEFDEIVRESMKGVVRYDD
jgi:hypothetical protein